VQLLFIKVLSIGVTYQYPPLFGLGYRTPTFQDTGEAFAVIRGDLWRSNYTKTVFGRGLICPGTHHQRAPVLCRFPSIGEVCGRACRAKPQTLTHLYFFLLTCATICFIALFGAAKPWNYYFDVFRNFYFHNYPYRQPIKQGLETITEQNLP